MNIVNITFNAELIDVLGAEDFYILMQLVKYSESDHIFSLAELTHLIGMGKATKLIYSIQWLESEGYISIRKDSGFSWFDFRCKLNYQIMYPNILIKTTNARV